MLNDWLREQAPAAKAWDAGGQFRVRYEAKEHAGSFPNRDFARDLDNSNDYFLFRVRAHLGWRAAGWFTARVEGRHARSSSDARGTPESDSADLHQAWVRFGDPRKFPVSVQLGRQELIYGDQRYAGNADWSNLLRSFDAARLRFENKGSWLDVFAGRPVIARDGHFNEVNHDDWFSGIYASSSDLFPRQTTEAYLLARNVRPGSTAPGPRDIYTLGTRWKSVAGKSGPWDYSIEAALQSGSIRQSGADRDHRAFALNVSGGRTWSSTTGSPRAGIGYDFGSGDSNPGDGRNETFELLFGTNHRLYGNMDLMGLRNMHIPRIEASFKPTKSISVGLEWLGFWLADTADFFYPESGAGRSQNGYGRNPGFDSWVGHEIDLLVDWRVSTWGQIRTGYGRFTPGSYIERSIESVPANGGVVGAHWIYVQGSLNF